MPIWKLLDAQLLCRDDVLPPDVPARLVVELEVSWDRRCFAGEHGDMLGFERVGIAALAGVLLCEYGFVGDHVATYARALPFRSS